MKLLLIFIYSFPYLFQVHILKPCLMNLLTIIVQFHLTRGTMIERLLLMDSFQVDIRSAQNSKSPKNLIAVPQSVARIDVLNEANNIVFDI